MIENGNGRAGHLLEIESGEPDDLKVSAVTAVVSAAMWYQRERTKQARLCLVGCVRDCLVRLLGREPTEEEIGRALRGEL